MSRNSVNRSNSTKSAHSFNAFKVWAARHYHFYQLGNFIVGKISGYVLWFTCRMSMPRRIFTVLPCKPPLALKHQRYNKWNSWDNDYLPSCISSGCLLQLCQVSSVLPTGSSVRMSCVYKIYGQTERQMDRVVHIYPQNLCLPRYN